MNKYLKDKISKLNDDQKKLFGDMQNDSLLQICIPTGAGKGYLMMADILNGFYKDEHKIFAVASHRLMLNAQHMKDIFFELFHEVGNVGFVFVGSLKYNTAKLQEGKEVNTALASKGLSYDEIISSTTRKKEVEELVAGHIAKGRKVVVLTTYHSMSTISGLEIDTLYCDEAHTLASENESQFKKAFLGTSSKRCFFMTATPKDCQNSDDAFLMNNEEVFGKRIGLSFKECVEKGYVVKPVIHVAMPSDVIGTYNFDSIDNKVKFVIETFEAHRQFVAQNSSAPEQIAPKMLIKCGSVDEMWALHAVLKESMQGVLVCAGASRNPNSMVKHFIGDTGVKDRNEYLDMLVDIPDGEMAVVLHYDTMSEGINVSGFTSTMFLGGTLPTIMKTLQNVGRSTRLHRADRMRIKDGVIDATDYSQWVKPYCAVIIPYWDDASEFTTKELASQIKKLRDEFDFDPTYKVSIGSDIADGISPDDMFAPNKDEDSIKKFKLIDEINQEIEVLDSIAQDQAHKEALNAIPFKEWFFSNL